MAQQQLIWTALPNGFKPLDPESSRPPEFRQRPTLRLSVHVAPRLFPAQEEQPTLDTFPDFQHWPETVGAANYVVRFFTADGQHQDIPATRVDLNADVRLDPDLWIALFPSQHARAHL